MNSTPLPEPPEHVHPRTFWLLAAALTAEVVAFMAFTTPNEGFTRWAFLDSGADLSLRSMLARGLRPTIDFGYIYGLLPLAIGQVWQGIFGSTPTACRAATLVCHVALACGLARLASTLKVGFAGLALIAVAMPDMLLTSTVVLVHVLEPALLINALAFQAKGQRSTALALATACLFVKPTMGYLYGLVLVIEILSHDGRKAWRSLVPALATGLILAGLLAILYGPVPLIRTLLPGGGMAVYRQQQYGFFNTAGRQFWVIPGGGLRDYFRYEVGGWIVGAVLLALDGLLAVRRILRRVATPRDEVILTCAVLHTVFVLAFFGNRFSWIYYYCIMISGIAATAAVGRRHAAVVLTLAAVVLAGSKVKTQENAKLWTINRPSADNFGLWTIDSQRAEWNVVRDLIKESRPAGLLADVEGITVLAPGLFLPPVTSYLVEGHTIPVEVRRKAEQISGSKWVVSTRAPDGYGYWPEIAAALADFRIVRKSGMFWVLRREAADSSAE